MLYGWEGWEETKSLEKQLPAQSKGALFGLKAGFCFGHSAAAAWLRPCGVGSRGSSAALCLCSSLVRRVLQRNHRIPGSAGLEKPSKIIESNLCLIPTFPPSPEH